MSRSTLLISALWFGACGGSANPTGGADPASDPAGEAPNRTELNQRSPTGAGVNIATQTHGCGLQLLLDALPEGFWSEAVSWDKGLSTVSVRTSCAFSAVSGDFRAQCPAGYAERCPGKCKHPTFRSEHPAITVSEDGQRVDIPAGAAFVIEYQVFGVEIRSGNFSPQCGQAWWGTITFKPIDGDEPPTRLVI